MFHSHCRKRATHISKTNLVTCTQHVSQQPLTSQTQMVDFTYQRVSHISKTNFVTCLVFEIHSWHKHVLGHLLRDYLINAVKMSVRPYVRTSVLTYVHRPQSNTMQPQLNQIVVFVRVDETFTTIWLSRSSKVRVKVTWDLKFQKRRFSNSISSAIFQPIKKYQRFLILDQNI